MKEKHPPADVVANKETALPAKRNKRNGRATGSNGGKTILSSRYTCYLDRTVPARVLSIDAPFQAVAGCFEVQREGGTHNAQASHEFSAHLRQCAEHMLDAGALREDVSVAPFLRGRNIFGCVDPALDVDLPAGLFEIAFALGAGVAPVGIHRLLAILRKSL